MNIVHVSIGRYPLPIKNCGCENVILELCSCLKKIEGNEISIIDLKSEEHQSLKNLYTFHEVYNLPIKDDVMPNVIIRRIFYSMLTAFKLFKLNKQKEINIVHLYNQFSAASAIVLKKIFGLKYKTVYTLLSVAPMAEGFVEWMRGPLESFVLKNCDQIIAITPEVKKCLIERYGFNEQKITQLFLGVDINRIEKFVHSHEKRNIYNTDKVIIYVARILPRKNQMALVKAMTNVCKVFSDAKCLLAGPEGDNQYVNEIKTYIRQNNLEKNVILCGDTDKDSLDQLYLDSMISVIPSLLETQGMILIESLAFGLPVAASNIGPFADVVNLKSGSGILFNPQDIEEISRAIIELLSKNELREDLILKSKEIIKKFDWKEIAFQMSEMYRHITSKK